MGVLGKFKLRRDRESMKKMSGAASVVKGKPTAIVKRRPHHHHANDTAQSPIARHLSERTAPFEPVEVSMETVNAMEVAIQQELTSTTAPRTVTNIAIALADSRAVLKIHANQSSKRTPLEKLTKRLRNFSFRKGAYKSEEDVVRRYQIMGAFNRLESLPGSVVKKISSWEEAKEALRAVIRFPEEQQDADEAAGEEPAAETDIAAKFMKEMDDVYHGEETENLKPYSEMWKRVASFPTPSKIGDSEQSVDTHTTALEKADDMFRLRLASATAKLEERRRQASKEVEERLRVKELEEEARKRASSLMRPLSEEERQRVTQALHGRQPPGAILAQCDADSVQQSSMWTLQPGQWVNDEIIHYFLLMLAERDEEICQKDSDRKRCHFFKSFFITKIMNEGHATLDGKYEYKNVKRWSKKVPGKDLFKLDKIFFPINQGQMHWLCACAFITEKRIEVYDSMGSPGTKYLNCIFQYLQDDHMDKKGCPLPDLDEWELVRCRDDTPSQRNGKYDDR
jgi:hypothetical protein